MATLPDEKTYRINVGPLNGLGSLCLHLGQRLAHLNEVVRQGNMPEIIWDLASVQPRRQNMAALTAFMSIAHRISTFMGAPQKVLVRWDPNVLAFWDDISFFELSRMYRVFDWPKDLVGGYSSGQTNPNTKLIAFHAEHVPHYSDLEAWQKWKDDKRLEVSKELVFRCGMLFDDRSHSRESARLRDQVAITAAELVVNALLHGKETAFVGMQKSPRGISVAVCDSGRGFLNSLRDKPNVSFRRIPPFHVDAVLFGTIMNLHEMGLRRAIDAVVKTGGHVLVSSYNAEIRWERPLWERVIHTGEFYSIDKPYHIPNATSLMGNPIKGRADYQTIHDGYYREWDIGLRGTRITFEIPT